MRAHNAHIRVMSSDNLDHTHTINFDVLASAQLDGVRHVTLFVCSLLDSTVFWCATNLLIKKSLFP